MALPPTGSQITMTEIRNYFSASGTPIVMSVLGSYIGIAVGNTIAMSAAFGGLTNSGNNWQVASLVPGGGVVNKPVPYLYLGHTGVYNCAWVDGGQKLAVSWQGSSGSEETLIWNIPNPYDLTSLVGDGVPDIYIAEPTNKGAHAIDFNDTGTKMLTQHSSTLGFNIQGAIVRNLTTAFDPSTASTTPDETFTDMQRSSGYQRNGLAWRDSGYMFCYMGEKSTKECSWEIYRTMPGQSPYTISGLDNGGFPNLVGIVDNTSTSYTFGGFADDGIHFWGSGISGKTVDMKTHGGQAWFDWQNSTTTSQNGGPDLGSYGRILPFTMDPTGTKAISGAPGFYGAYVSQYTLGTAWDVSTFNNKTNKPARHSGAHLSMYHYDDAGSASHYTGLNPTSLPYTEGGVCWNGDGTAFISIINRKYVEQDMATAYDFSTISAGQAMGAWTYTATMPTIFSSTTAQNVLSMQMHPISGIGIAQAYNYNGVYYLMYRRTNSAGTIQNGISGSYSTRTIGSTLPVTDFKVQRFVSYSPTYLTSYPYIHYAYIQGSSSAQTLTIYRGTSSVMSSPSAASFWSSLNLVNITGISANLGRFARCFAMSDDGLTFWVTYNPEYYQTRQIYRCQIYQITVPTAWSFNSASITATFTLPWYIQGVTGMDVNGNGTALILRDNLGYLHSYEIP